ncbi:MAG: Crp/Fnr family transcriptional regulator [Candidatus Dactylopiibacterium carminicum]|uniref:Crp/Fnr family transcriptional regulator n=1 Tax=Candidatus Dactylopiibacterium carminicum TaxID=857335 RepID=A0A272EVC9_9RHOO|nr:Crp/Fnr family transcriptional regulator [Candidatus Dactylopiibacterium carminicum]KAF7600107.1 Crp/Fnr family transcriptional regulator [Candidatus Dactylopiibacterium carminicum]PAS94063.1 MAG: Crp/Fnr family transcriptional regulator [Candidatus Dactylopiibacterium carminicum]PAS98174.1 MAG: Crp/Fnr family transcriptional regulator [Candidatus Dactylopiibacterium carminicum]PAT00107.1 MAG: Crp/Fnr family transcriptional regulator [Candidatus Dactylopiibacterium carminicum]
MQTPPKADVRGLLGRLPLFSALAPHELDRIAADTTEHRLARGEVLFRQHSPCTGFFMVAHGQIKLAVSAPNGNEKVLEIIPPHMSFGEAMMFLDRPFPVTASALTESLVLGVRREAVLSVLDNDPHFARRLLAGMSLRLHSLVRDVEGYALRSSTQRLIGFLLSAGGAADEAQGSLSVDLPTSKQVLASRLSVTPETLSRILHGLADAGLVQLDGKTIHIPDVAHLRDFEA